MGVEMRGPTIKLDQRYRGWSLSVPRAPQRPGQAAWLGLGTVRNRRTALRLWVALMALEDGQ